MECRRMSRRTLFERLFVFGSSSSQDHEAAQTHDSAQRAGEAGQSPKMVCNLESRTKRFGMT